jgi:PAS domain S-box-containing protein
MRIFPAFWATLIHFVLLTVSPAQAMDSVTLQLRRAHSFQFAGYYAARELGYYRDAGLDVTIREAKPNQNIVDEVTSGKAQFGVGTSQLLLERQKGAPVVTLAVIFQHSPYVLATRGGADGIQNVHDLAGKRVMVGPHGAELLAYLQREGIPLDRIIKQDQTFNIQDLISGNTDALASYVGNEPFALRQAGFEYLLFSPRMGGIDFYGDNLFTAEKELRDNPSRVKAFRQASLRGWEYAAAYPDEVIGMIQEKYSTEKSSEALRFDATETITLIKADQVQVGYMYLGRWQHMAEVYAELGMLPTDFDLNGFLYNPNPATDHRKLYIYLAITLACLCLVTLVSLRVIRVNRRRLQSSQTELAASENLFQTLTDSSAAGILVFRKERVLFANPAMSTITGYSSEELYCMSALDLIESETKNEATECAETILQSEAIAKSEYMLLTKDSSLRWVKSLSAKVIFQGEPATLLTLVDITDRKLAEERLLDSEMDLKNAQRLGGMGNWRFETAINQIYWSDETFNILEIDPKQIDASLARFFELVYPEDRDVTIHAFNALREKRTPYDLKHRLLMPDGRVKIIRNLGQVSTAEYNTPLRLKGIIQDITESELAQEKRFLQLFDAAPIPLIWIVKQNGQLVFEYFNRSFKETYGYTINEVKTLDDFHARVFTSPEQRARSAALWQTTFENPDRIKSGIRAVEEEYVCKNGDRRTMLLSVGRIGEDNWLAAHVDITARKKAEMAR